MKKLFLTILLLAFTSLNAFATDEIKPAYKDTYILGIKKSEKAKIKSLLRNLNKYSNDHDISSIKPFYSKDYISYDGFNYDAFFSAIDETFITYPDISYKSKIKSVDIKGDWAAVEVVDKTFSKRQTIAQAIINNKAVVDKTMKGTMESTCHYVIYLKKISDRWLIYSDNIITEETSIKYGITNDMGISVYSPLTVNEGEEYCISLNVEKQPKDSIMLASIAKEEIKYPPVVPKDVFRKMPREGILERVVSANKNGINEYSLASIGITELSLNEDKTAINYKMSGIAFLMKRVNVYKIKNITDKTQNSKETL